MNHWSFGLLWDCSSSIRSLPDARCSLPRRMTRASTARRKRSRRISLNSPVSGRRTAPSLPEPMPITSRRTNDFSARLAVISLRAASDPGGVACATALTAATRLGNQVGLASATAAMPTNSNESCISLEVASVQKQFLNLQRQDELRCTTPGPACATLFPPGTLADFLPNNNSGKAPFSVRGVVVALDSLVGFEQDLKPQTKG